MLLPNTLPEHGAPLLEPERSALSHLARAPVRAFLAECGHPAPTPLLKLPALAAEAGVGEIWIKDEASRLGLGSFKALGGAFAVLSLAREHGAAGLTVACATDGNHGRAVAWGAAKAGARAVIFIHEGVSDLRARAIAAFGAEIVRVKGSYDDSVEEAARRCEAEGWLLVSDTSPDPETVSPRLVMQGYAQLVAEALEQMPAPPTHCFVQAGVGGLAAAVAGSLALALGERRPRVVVVEPARAPCLLESVRAGRAIRIPEGEPTVMAMLECYEPSASAWRVLARAADAFMTVEEDEAVTIMRRLSRRGGDPTVVAGESGGVGLAGLLRAAAVPAARSALHLSSTSRVLTINTEGATDPQRYRMLVGHEPAVPS